MTFCPDCEQQILDTQFVEHRETEHPPAPKTLAIAGITTSERFGYAPPDAED